MSISYVGRPPFFSATPFPPVQRCFANSSKNYLDQLVSAERNGMIKVIAAYEPDLSGIVTRKMSMSMQRQGREYVSIFPAHEPLKAF